MAVSTSDKFSFLMEPIRLSRLRQAILLRAFRSRCGVGAPVTILIVRFDGNRNAWGRWFFLLLVRIRDVHPLCDIINRRQGGFCTFLKKPNARRPDE